MTHTSDWDRRERNRGGILEIVMLALALTLGPAGIGRAQTSPVPADTGTAPAPGNMMAAPIWHRPRARRPTARTRRPPIRSRTRMSS